MLFYPRLYIYEVNQLIKPHAILMKMEQEKKTQKNYKMFHKVKMSCKKIIVEYMTRWN